MFIGWSGKTRTNSVRRSGIQPELLPTHAIFRSSELSRRVIVLVIAVIALTIYIGLVVLGVKLAIRKNRSPHWMWFAIHPVGLLVTLIVMAA